MTVWCCDGGDAPDKEHKSRGSYWQIGILWQIFNRRTSWGRLDIEFWRRNFWCHLQDWAYAKMTLEKVECKSIAVLLGVSTCACRFSVWLKQVNKLGTCTLQFSYNLQEVMGVLMDVSIHMIIKSVTLIVVAGWFLKCISFPVASYIMVRTSLTVALSYLWGYVKTDV